MHLKNYVRIFDEILPLNVLSNLIKYINIVNFEEAKILAPNVEDQVNFNIRRTYSKDLQFAYSNSLSEVHWCNLLTVFFKKNIQNYVNELKAIDFGCKDIIQLTLLKYEEFGFYTWHTDHSPDAPRTLSCIFLLNNDYEGGNLCFRNPDGSGEWEIEVKPNRMIIWPSNFLYPHTVKPVTKGKRYSVVAWAL